VTETQQMLKNVGFRRRLALWGRQFSICFFIIAALYAAVLLASRFSGKIPDRFEPWTLLTIPVGAFVLSFLTYKRPTDVELAHLVDERSGTKDLYLTTALLEKSPGQYAPLVARDAEQQAGRIKPEEVVPWQWSRSALNSAIVLGVLLAGIFCLPQFDPFGDIQAAQAEETRKVELKKSRKATKQRTAELKKSKDGVSEESKEVAKAVEKLKKDFKKSRRNDPQGNSQRLAAQQKLFGEKWRKLNQQKLNELFNKAEESNQTFGGMNKSKLAKWSRELQQGSTEALNKEIEAIKSELKKLAKTKDPVKKAELREKIKERLRDLEELASNKMDAKPLAAAIKRAMKQLDASKRQGMSTEALEALEETIDLAKMELQQVAQSAEDLQKLEKALEAIQQAKKLNGQGELDGEDMEGLDSLEDYAEYYAQRMAGRGPGGEGEGEGTGGEGIGRGGEVEENDDIDTKYVNEKAKVEVRAGKVLLTLKDKGLSDSGDAKIQYRDSIQKVKQGVSEAIIKEQIPPGYLEGIKSYFDTLDADETETPAE